jgi:alpha-tubulin suppressor-like RCC1 family protein
VSAGADHTCAIVNTRVYCWGSNAYGQLGDGSITGTGSYSITPVLVESGVRDLAFASVAAGSTHTCATTTGQAMYCWGSNDAGQLGTVTFDQISERPVRVASDLLFGSVVAGFRFTCAQAFPGVWCWGDGSLGQLGDGRSGVSHRSAVPVRAGVGDVQVVNDGFVRLVAGRNHACMVESGGAVMCWGAGASGQLGTGGRPAASGPVRLAPGDQFSVVGLAAGGGHTCIGGLDRNVRCTGENSSGQHGNGTRTDTVELTGMRPYVP